MSKPRQGDLSPASVSYTAGFYHIPVIGISSRDSAFSDKVWKLKYQTNDISILSLKSIYVSNECNKLQNQERVILIWIQIYNGLNQFSLCNGA